MEVVGADHLRGVNSDNFIQIELPQKEPALADTMKRGKPNSSNQKTPQEIILINNEAEDEDVQFLAELERENQALEMELKALQE